MGASSRREAETALGHAFRLPVPSNVADSPTPPPACSGPCSAPARGRAGPACPSGGRAHNAPVPHVNSVLGPLHPAQLGTTSLHEHLLWADPGWEYSPEARAAFDAPVVFAKVHDDLVEWKAAGGSTIVDCSGVGLGRDPELYATWSRASGVNVVCSTGFWARDKILPYFALRDLDYMVGMMVHELTVGMGTTSIRAGVVKVGNSKDGMWPIEEQTYRAAARAARQTGALIITHGVNFAERQVEVLLEEGVDPSRVVISHLDAAYNLDYDRDLRILRQGFAIGYDHIGTDPDWSPEPYAMKDTVRADMVRRAVADGYVDQLVLACDANGWSVGLAHRTTPRHTFAHLLRGFVPLLRERGVTDEQVHRLLVETPRRLLPLG